MTSDAALTDILRSGPLLPLLPSVDAFHGQGAEKSVSYGAQVRVWHSHVSFLGQFRANVLHFESSNDQSPLAILESGRHLLCTEKCH